MKPLHWLTLPGVLAVVLTFYFAFSTYFLMVEVVKLREELDYHVTRSSHSVVRLHIEEIEKRLQQLDHIKAQPWPLPHRRAHLAEEAEDEQE